MPRSLQQQINATFTNDTGTWYGFFTGVGGFYSGGISGDMNDHLFRSYMRQANLLGVTGDYLFPYYDDGLRLTGDSLI